ncbi:FUSC family protein [Streptomyces bambusae]|uniref:FUSC family protein n=1 Tax=Streptomyces bambusae TaxID=1550616 RepID=UPI0027DF9FFB|nr:FUSC family protein [Streptomyces bambusae]
MLRREAALLELVDAALVLSTAVGLSVRGRAGAPPAPSGRFWYARMRAPHLWWRRLVGHAGRRSVFFQNAVRISLALAAARVVAGLDTLPHGFWAMLATLTLTRTTVGATRADVRQALVGTLIGAVVTAALLAGVGTHIAVYAAALPALMLVAFTVGPVKGVGWAQALFTLLIALVFAQLAPVTWQLAEFRLLDVLIGSAIGAVFALLAWPQGAQEEVGRSAAELLRCAAAVVVIATAEVVAGAVRQVREPPGLGPLRHMVVLAESAFAQYQSEPRHWRGAAPDGRTGGPRAPDWQASLLVGHHALWGADRLLASADASASAPVGGAVGSPAGGPVAPVREPPLGPEAAESLTRLADRVSGRMLLLSAVLDPVGDADQALLPSGRPDTVAKAPADAPRRYYALVAWLEDLLADLDRITGTGTGTGTATDADAGADAKPRGAGIGTDRTGER